jgi:hypothetical protein
MRRLATIVSCSCLSRWRVNDGCHDDLRRKRVLPCHHGNCGEMAKMGCAEGRFGQTIIPQVATTGPSMDLHWTVVDWLKP